MARVDRVVWDTNVVIDLLQKTPERERSIRPFVEQAEDGRLEILLSNVTVVELHGIHGLRTRGTPADAAAAIVREFLNLPYVIRRPLHDDLADEAAAIARTHGIKRAADAVVVALAVQEGVQTVHTYDGSGRKPGLIALSGKVGTPPITIEAPDPGIGNLFERLGDD